MPHAFINVQNYLLINPYLKDEQCKATASTKIISSSDAHGQRKRLFYCSAAEKGRHVLRPMKAETQKQVHICFLDK